MLTQHRGGDDLARSSDEEQRYEDGVMTVYRPTRSDRKQKTYEDGVETVGSLTSGRLCLDTTAGLIGGTSSSFREVNTWLTGDVYDWLSEEVQLKMARSVVSLSLFDGCTKVLTCSGIPIESKKSVTRLLTPENVYSTFIDKSNSGGNMKIEVRDAFGTVVRGWLEQPIPHRGFTLINVEKSSLDVSAVHLDCEVEILPGSNLLGVELEHGKPTVIRGILTENSSTSEAGIDISYSTCKISEAGDGGPLFDGYGNFVGMNMFLDKERGAFMKRSVIIERLKQFEKRVEFLSCRRRRRHWPQKHDAPYPEGNELTNQDRLVEDLDSLGYTKPVDYGMVLANSFEDTFGDKHVSGQGVWGMLSETVSNDLSRSVVSLASYKGETRLFACSGILTKCNGCTTVLTSASLVRDRLDENKISENLRIVMCLTDKQRTEGTLLHYNLHYNIAIVSFRGSCALPTVNLYEGGAISSSQVIAVGRCFESGMLMATRGNLTRWHKESTFDCGAIHYSSCETTKAGIGGPLVDFEGKFVGLNFYDWEKGTPFLPQALILRVVAHFEKKWLIAESDDNGYVNRWPVPKPFWRRSDQPQRIQDK